MAAVPCSAPILLFAAPGRLGRFWGGRMNIAETASRITAAAAVQMSIERVSKAFGGVTAVNDVSIDIPTARILSIIGPNGAGKTSLLNMISGFYKPDTGRILLRQPRHHQKARRAISRRSA